MIRVVSSEVCPFALRLSVYAMLTADSEILTVLSFCSLLTGRQHDIDGKLKPKTKDQ